MKLPDATALFASKEFVSCFLNFDVAKVTLFQLKKNTFKKKGGIQRNGDIGGLQKWKHGRQETWRFCHYWLRDGPPPSVSLGLSFLACWIT